VSIEYKAILWNRQKRIYDLTLSAFIVAYLLLFVGMGTALQPAATPETLLIRGFGTLAFFLLHVTLAIGPLCRLDSRFLPLLYNRRHLGVTLFLCALAHGGLAVFQFHSLGNVNPFVSLLVSNTRVDSLRDFPFQQLGFAALAILFLMAATSHDFWLHNLTPAVWKSLHMSVYLAYALLVGHVALGALQDEPGTAAVVLFGSGLFALCALHVAAALKELKQDRSLPVSGGYVDAGPVDSIPENQARVVALAGERIAIFRYDGKVSAVSNVCRHQNGPLGEGRILDGCITCPWHGYQYLPDSGTSPPPFDDKISTYCVRVENGHAWVDPRPNPPGTRVEPAIIPPL